MKKYLLIIILSFHVLLTYAQSQSDSRYSIGLKLLSIEEIPKMLNETRDHSQYYVMPFNGLILKLNDNQISYRVAAYGFSKSNYSFNNECASCEVVAGKYTSLDIKLGFEKSLRYSDLQPFYGMDIGYKKANFDGDAQKPNTSAFMYHANVDKNGALIYPFFGVKYNIIKSITLSVETGIDFIGFHEKEIKTDANGQIVSLNNYTRWRFNTRPLGLLSLQYNFGDND